MIVLDACVVVAALVDSGYDGQWAESVVADCALAAPELMLVETTNILRRVEQSGQGSTGRE